MNSLKVSYGFEDRSPIKVKLINKTLAMVGAEFTFKELKREINKRKVFNKLTDRGIYQRIRRLKNAGIITSEPHPDDNRVKVYTVKEKYQQRQQN